MVATRGRLFSVFRNPRKALNLENKLSAYTPNVTADHVNDTLPTLQLFLYIFLYDFLPIFLYDFIGISLEMWVEWVVVWVMVFVGGVMGWLLHSIKLTLSP